MLCDKVNPTMMCELAEAGCRNNYKIMDEMQRVDLFWLSHQSGDRQSSTQAEVHKQGCTHCRAQSLLEDQ